MIYGLRLVVSEAAMTSPWIFPKERFFEWEPKDEPFCRKYGIGYAAKSEPCMYRIGNTLVCHPDLVDAIKKVCKFDERDPYADMPLIRPGGFLINSVT